MGSNTIVTIGRQFCSKGNEIGQALSVRLGIPYYDDFILEKAAADHGIPVAYAEHYDEKPASPFEQSVAMASFFYSTAETMATTQEQLSQAQRRTILELAEQVDVRAVENEYFLHASSTSRMRDAFFSGLTQSMMWSAHDK